MKKEMTLRKMLNLEVLSEKEQDQVRGGRIRWGGCDCPCSAPTPGGDWSGYYIFDNLWAQNG